MISAAAHSRHSCTAALGRIHTVSGSDDPAVAPVRDAPRCADCGAGLGRWPAWEPRVVCDERARPGPVVRPGPVMRPAGAGRSGGITLGMHTVAFPAETAAKRRGAAWTALKSALPPSLGHVADN